MVDANGVPVPDTDSDAATFSNLNPDTSDAHALGGQSTRYIWGTDVSITDSFRCMKDFLSNYQKKYRLIADGELMEGEMLAARHGGLEKEYKNMLETMLDFGTTSLYLDCRNLKAYPPTRKLWHQLQSFPSEIIPLMDTAVKDTIISWRRNE